MAEETNKKPAKKRQLKRTETVRQRAERTQTTPPKKRRVKKAASKVWLPFKIIWKVLAFVGRPFAFLLIPFKTRPARFVGRIIAGILLFRFFRESWAELRQVQWPNARETARLTMAVFVFALVFGVIIAITDYGLGKVFKELFIN